MIIKMDYVSFEGKQVSYPIVKEKFVGLFHSVGEVNWDRETKTRFRESMNTKWDRILSRRKSPSLRIEMKGQASSSRWSSDFSVRYKREDVFVGYSFGDLHGNSLTIYTYVEGDWESELEGLALDQPQVRAA